MKKIKVLHIIPNMGDGGAQQIVINYLNDFRYDKHIECRLLVLESKTNSKYDKIIEKENFCVDYLNIPKKYSKVFFLNGLKRIIVLSKKINEYIRKNKPDIVHMHTTGLALFCLNHVRRNKNITNFLTIHSNPLRDKGINLWAMKKILKYSNVVPICLNNELVKLSQKHYCIEKCEIVRNGIDIDKMKKEIVSQDKARKEYNISKNAFVVLSIGRLNKIKQFDKLIRIFSNIVSVNKESLLIIAGEGEEKNSLIDLAHDLKIDNNVRLIGNIENVSSLYCAADVFVVTSKSESASLVFLEAQVFGLKCVISSGVPKESIVTKKVIMMKEDASDEEWSNEILSGNKYMNSYNNLEDYDVKKSSSITKELYVKYWKDCHDEK